MLVGCYGRYVPDTEAYLTLLQKGDIYPFHQECKGYRRLTEPIDYNGVRRVSVI